MRETATATVTATTPTPPHANTNINRRMTHHPLTEISPPYSASSPGAPSSSPLSDTDCPSLPVTDLRHVRTYLLQLHWCCVPESDDRKILAQRTTIACTGTSLTNIWKLFIVVELELLQLFDPLGKPVACPLLEVCANNSNNNNSRTVNETVNYITWTVLLLLRIVGT